MIFVGLSVGFDDCVFAVEEAAADDDDDDDDDDVTNEVGPAVPEVLETAGACG